MKMAKLLLMWLLVLPALALAQARPTFTPQAGFGGASDGNGTLKLLFGKPRHYHVDSVGRVLADGSFRLDQTVLFEEKSPRTVTGYSTPCRRVITRAR